MTDKELLVGTLERLRGHGWLQGAGGPSEGPNCIHGAAIIVTGCYKEMSHPIVRGVMNRVALLLGFQGWRGVASFNDAASDFSVVEQALLDAIARVEEQSPIEELVCC